MSKDAEGTLPLTACFFQGFSSFLVPQHGERAKAGRVRQDNLVDIAAFGGHERRQEARLVLLGALGKFLTAYAEIRI